MKIRLLIVQFFVLMQVNAQERFLMDTNDIAYRRQEIENLCMTRFFQYIYRHFSEKNLQVH